MTDTNSTTETTPAPRLLKEIAVDIFYNWKTMRERGENHPAWGYAHAMRSLDTVQDMYYADRADDIVQRFLSEARVWRGPKAQEIKAELKALLSK